MGMQAFLTEPFRTEGRSPIDALSQLARRRDERRQQGLAELERLRQDVERLLNIHFCTVTPSEG